MKYQDVELHNVGGITGAGDQAGIRISRLPHDVRERINPAAQKRAWQGSGCEIRGMLADGGSARVVLMADDSDTTPAMVSVYHGCFRGQAVLLKEEPTEIVIKTPSMIEFMETISRIKDLPFDPRLVRVRLPALNSSRILSIEGDLRYPAPGVTPKQTLLCYGSSITQGASAVPPEGTYAAQCARRLGLDLINLGFAGSAEMDAAISAHIAARTDWDIAVLEMGINVRGWPNEKFQEAVTRFVGTVVAAHPDKLIFCIDLFTHYADFKASAPKAEAFRKIVQEVAAGTDSSRVIHVDGRMLLEDPSGLLTDLVHPGHEGMQEMGDNLAALIRRSMENVQKKN
ncbi:MAG TPA: hypothetical protein DCS43_11625 [Verrucomicrobia bacterium]|nr:hypothetical protein [Verrucomicrobiota bacterium]